MRYFMSILVGTMLLASGCAEVKTSEVKSGASAPGFTLKNQNDKEVSLADYKDKVVVLEFTNFGCPFVKKHYNTGNMQALQKKYREKGVVWLQICSSAPGKQGHFEVKEIKTKITTYKSQADHYLRDETGVTGKAFGAKTTPHMFILDKTGAVVYQGAIDKLRSTKTSDIGKEGNTNYVVQALDELLSGKAVSIPKTKSYGCSVKY